METRFFGRHIWSWLLLFDSTYPHDNIQNKSRIRVDCCVESLVVIGELNFTNVIIISKTKSCSNWTTQSDLNATANDDACRVSTLSLPSITYQCHLIAHDIRSNKGKQKWFKTKGNQQKQHIDWVGKCFKIHRITLDCRSNWWKTILYA